MVGNDPETQPWTNSLLSKLYSLGFTGHQEKNSVQIKFGRNKIVLCNSNKSLLNKNK